VQHTNGAFNREVSADLKYALRHGAQAGDYPAKVRALLDYAASSPHPSAFVDGAVSAQEGASRWDGAFDMLLRRRFGD
jgi:hypothetical protein